MVVGLRLSEMLFVLFYKEMAFNIYTNQII